MMKSEIAAPFQFWSNNSSENPVTTTSVPVEVDSIVIISSNISKESCPTLNDLIELLKRQKTADDAFEDVETFMSVTNEQYKNLKLVYSPTGPLNRDHDDVRRVYDATIKGFKRALKAGSKKIFLAVLQSASKFAYSPLVSLLGAAESIYVPFEVRQFYKESSKVNKIQMLQFNSYEPKSDMSMLRFASAIESGRVLCRDIGGSDPEVMAPPNVASYVQEIFAGTCIKVEIISDEKSIQENFPLLAAVNRAARGIERHQARVIFLSYEPVGPCETTIVLVGKGVTYDTGGADIKAGGVMAGMHRDKCGAAAVAGFFQVLAALKPEKVKVLGAMAMVRNSVGSDCYVADEIIQSRSGCRVRVGNTDAEGRMAMADVLCYMKEKVINEKNPHLFTIATLTGHACLAVGDGYSIVMENGPAKHADVGHLLQKAGEDVGDMFEVSTIRREDYDFVKGKSEYEDLLQSNNAPSIRTPRGHQLPAAFLIIASGLDKHGIDSETSLKYCHIDIAASSGPFPGIPSGAPIAALTKHFIMNA